MDTDDLSISSSGSNGRAALALLQARLATTTASPTKTSAPVASPDDSVASLDSANFALLSRYSSNTPMKVPTTLNVEFNKENAAQSNSAKEAPPPAKAKVSAASSTVSAIEKANALLAKAKNKRGTALPVAKKTVEFAAEVQTKPPTPVKPVRTPSKARPAPAAKTPTPAKKVLKKGASTPGSAKKILKKKAGGCSNAKDYKAMAYESGVRLASSELRVASLQKQLEELKNFGVAEADALRKDLEKAGAEIEDARAEKATLEATVEMAEESLKEVEVQEGQIKEVREATILPYLMSLLLTSCHGHIPLRVSLRSPLRLVAQGGPGEGVL